MRCRHLTRIALRLGIVAAVAAVTLAPTAQGQTSQVQSLHDALHLSAAQEDAWRTFQTAIAPDSDQAARDQSAAQMMPTLSAPRRVDLSIAVLQADLATLERRGAALKVFYATLSQQQQKIFDQQTAPQSPRGQ